MELKKGIFAIALGLASFTSIMAQTGTPANDDYVRPANQVAVNPSLDLNSISFGFGVGGSYPYEGTSYSSSPNLSLTYERIVLKHAGPGKLGVGVMLSYQQIASIYSDYTGNYTYQQTWNYYIVGARAVYHITGLPLKGIEPYVGGVAGYYMTRYKFTSTDPNYNDPADPGYYLTPNIYPDFFAFSIFAGVRSYISSHSIAWLEFGYGYANMAAGISYRF